MTLAVKVALNLNTTKTTMNDVHGAMIFHYMMDGMDGCWMGWDGMGWLDWMEL